MWFQVSAPRRNFADCEPASLDAHGRGSAFVSRGGLKLEAALNALPYSVCGKVCLDVGASTGGFTDCLLQRGARRVYAVDVGYGQLAWKLRRDPRVVAIERTNIREMASERIADPVDLVVVDVSFISLKIVVPAVLRLLGSQPVLVALIKPQFEVGRGSVGKGGVVKDPRLHAAVLEGLIKAFCALGLAPAALLPSPILGPKGNREFLIVLRPFSHRWPPPEARHDRSIPSSASTHGRAILRERKAGTRSKPQKQPAILKNEEE